MIEVRYVSNETQKQTHFNHTHGVFKWSIISLHKLERKFEFIITLFE